MLLPPTLTMADDTRQQQKPKEDLPREALTVDPENKSFSGTQWQGGKQIPYTPPENANMLMGGTEHTAGGKLPDVTISNAFPKLSDFQELHKRPCVRDAFLTGITGGAVIGGIRGIFGGLYHRTYCQHSSDTTTAAVWSACSWAVGTFCAASAVTHQYCLYKRQAEKEGMMRAVEILQKKDLEKKAREVRKEKMREERRAAKEEELDGRFAAAAATTGQAPPSANSSSSSGSKPWYKIW